MVSSNALDGRQLLIDNAVNKIHRGALFLSSCACSVFAPRLESYCGWFGRQVGVRHGDTTTGARRRLAVDQPLLELRLGELSSLLDELLGC